MHQAVAKGKTEEENAKEEGPPKERSWDPSDNTKGDWVLLKIGLVLNGN